MHRSIVSTAAVLGLAAFGFLYVALSGSPSIDGFDYERFSSGQPIDPARVQIAVVEDLRCPSCRRQHAEVLPLLTEKYVHSGKAAIVHVPFPFVRSDSMALSVKARSYALHHGVPLQDSLALLFAADSPRISLDQAESLLAERFGPIAVDARAALDAESERWLEETGRYIASLGISQTPTVIVDGTVLLAPNPVVLFEHIDAALERRRRSTLATSI